MKDCLETPKSIQGFISIFYNFLLDLVNLSCARGKGGCKLWRTPTSYHSRVSPGSWSAGGYRTPIMVVVSDIIQCSHLRHLWTKIGVQCVWPVRVRPSFSQIMNLGRVCFSEWDTYTFPLLYRCTYDEAYHSICKLVSRSIYIPFRPWRYGTSPQIATVSAKIWFVCIRILWSV